MSLFKRQGYLVSVAFMVLAAGLATACSNSRSPYASRPEVEAPALIKDAFTVQQTVQQTVQETSQQNEKRTALLTADKAQIAIDKAALEKEFLLHGNMIQQPIVAAGSGIKSRVVAFRKRGNHLFMMEASQGHSVTKDLPQNLILAKFPILHETDTHLSFDFNQGMSNLFTMSDWHAADFPFNPQENFISVKVQNSYIESAELNAKNQLHIRHIAQLEMPYGGGTLNVPVETRYYLQPYQPDVSFEPVHSISFDRVGFFEVAPQLTTRGTTKILASKWNEKNPIVFALSANTPAEYKAAVKEGVLYWNKAFGRDVVQVVEAPEGVTAPDLNYNLVQWVEWDQAGFAYADGQMDPRTGEILHAQVFLTSAFAFGGKWRAAEVLRALKDGQKQQIKRQIRLAGLGQQLHCNFEISDRLARDLAQLVASDVDDKKMLKIAQDYVREVTAHEIGHTLGLRHNFAGNLAMNFSVHDLSKHFEEYVKTGTTPAGLVTTSSVMEYNPFREGSMAGDQLVKQPKALDYDEKVINVLYNKKNYSNAEMPLFCTDSHVEKLVDCERFDSGSSFVEFSGWAIHDELENLPQTILGFYLGAKFPQHGEIPVAVERVQLPPVERMADRVLRWRLKFLNTLIEGQGLLKIQRQYPAMDQIRMAELRPIELNFLLAETMKIGGLENVLGRIDESFIAKSDQVLNELLSKAMAETRNGILLYPMTQAEAEVIRSVGHRYFVALHKALIKKDLIELSGGLTNVGAKLTDHELNDRFAELLKVRFDHYVMKTTGDITVADIEISDAPNVSRMVTAKMPKFRYPQEIRVLASGLLREERGESPAWGFLERKAASKELTGIVESALTVPLAKVQTEKASKPAIRWILENVQVQNSMLLGPGGPQTIVVNPAQAAERSPQ